MGQAPGCRDDGQANGVLGASRAKMRYALDASQGGHVRYGTLLCGSLHIVEQAQNPFSVGIPGRSLLSAQRQIGLQFRQAVLHGCRKVHARGIG